VSTRSLIFADAWGYINLGFQPETALKVQIILARRNALGNYGIESGRPVRAILYPEFK
jgi:hypothetical protein